ncbi:MAG: hypothetical protein IKF90_16080 [Parasporobacterium sp.]|nr:hypothetical protein [Parasporobacterium sp.]
MSRPEMNRKDKARREYVVAKFNELYMKRWKSQGRTAQEFANCVNEMLPMGVDGRCEPKYVSGWLHGKKSPEKYLGAISRVLNVDISEFFPSGSEEEYRYSAEYQNDVAIWQDKVAENSFGLNLSLMKGLRTLIDFDTDFPVYMPLQPSTADPEDGYPFGLKYERMEALEAAEATRGDGLFQLHRDGKTINLSPPDMKFLKVVQKAIIKYVTMLFEHHREELSLAAASATNKSKSIFEPGKVIDFGNDPLTAESLQMIDRYGFYTPEERKRYKIPTEPEGITFTAAYIQKPVEIKPQMDVKPIHEWLDMLPPEMVKRTDNQAPYDENVVDYDPGPAMDDNKDEEKEGDDNP